MATAATLRVDAVDAAGAVEPEDHPALQRGRSACSELDSDGWENTAWQRGLQLAECARRRLCEAPDAAILTSAAPPYCIVGVNRKWCLLCGYEPHQALGGTPKMLQGECTDAIEARAFAERVASSRAAATALVNYKSDGTPFLHILTAERLEGGAAGEAYVLARSIELPTAIA
eukprot:CAMPEP_0119353228 /NCGR_PEP_ID=MMETSP1334-20130426/2450_1 /TAXON_ID=127549 /ORGANISM="Calcidiscus leptoporus, Strain RCC1130" /LENGTH=172 /DNA_ID=CAMNT_0007366475 /DNA_START=33 /DNA_END=551 /DNA_ORIENTATION=-